MTPLMEAKVECDLFICIGNTGRINGSTCARACVRACVCVCVFIVSLLFMTLTLCVEILFSSATVYRRVIRLLQLASVRSTGHSHLPNIQENIILIT